MYQKSEIEKQRDLWTSTDTQLGERTRQIYDDPAGWHNLFRQQITNRVDEDIFKVLFSEKMGAPNAPIRVLVAMMALKEGMGISDERLYAEGRFNLQTRSALGMVNMEEEIPVESTYYLFRKRIVEYERETGKNLLDEAFDEITKGQCLEFGVSGQRLRMDSKLLGSNIAWYTRYEIVHETIKKYWNSREAAATRLPEEYRKLLEEITGESGRKVSYRSTKEELASRMGELGWLMQWLLKEPLARMQTEYALLLRVFEEQYVLGQGPGGGKKKHVLVREKTEVPPEPAADTERQDTESGFMPKGEDGATGSLAEDGEAHDEGTLSLAGPEGQEQTVRVRKKTEQPPASTIVTNPHDTEAEFRKKGGKTISGYSINVTETIDKDALNLIVDVRTEGAGTVDQRYLERAVEHAKGKVALEVEELYTDGGYHSKENQEYCKKEGIDWTLRGVSGNPSKYELTYDESGELVVFNTETKQEIPAKRTKSKDSASPERWVIKDGDSARRYFTDKDVEMCTLRKKVSEQPLEKQRIRNNVEATIFQLGYHYRGNKSRYRGLIKHRLWALSRCLWINFRRISAWIGKKEAEAAAQAGRVLKPFLLYFYKFIFLPQLA